MSSAERKRKRQPHSGGEAPAAESHNEESAAAGSEKQSPAAAASAARMRPPGPRIWVLPASGGQWWAASEESSVRETAESLREDAPVILCPDSVLSDGTARPASHLSEKQDARASVVECGKLHVDGTLRDEMHETVFVFAKHFTLCAVAVLVSLLGLKIPGMFRYFDEVLLLTGLGYLCYTVATHGYGAVRWHNRRVDASHAFTCAQVKPNALATRLAHALNLRSKLKQEERGKSPDDELLDTNAYRNLIRDGVTSRQELSVLGEAIESRLRFMEGEAQGKRIGDIARESGIDTESAIFYRDLCNAAKEIRLDVE